MTKPLALGIRYMLIDATARHRKADPADRLPRRFELPPLVYKDLLANMTASELLCAGHDGKFWGVPVVESMVDSPCMVTADNVSEPGVVRFYLRSAEK